MSASHFNTAAPPPDPRQEGPKSQWTALGRLTSPTTNRRAIVGEVLLLPMIAVALGLWLNPADPLWTGAEFPWPWFAPVVLALRYGPLSGIGGACVLLGAWFALDIGDHDHFPKLVFLGGLILVMLIGEFSSLWVARTRRAETMQGYLDQRLEFLTHQYYLLRLSHDRLEQDLISRPMAMRDALGIMRDTVLTDGQASEKSAAALLRLLSQYCQLETASLHGLRDDKPVSEPIATLGTPTPLRADDPLILHALETGRLCHVSQTLAEGEAPSRYLIAAPLTNLNGDLFGLLVVEHLPFFSLQDETLQTINLLLGYFSDGLSAQALAAPIRREVPACPPDFAFELQRLWHLRQDSKVASVVVALEILPRPGLPDLAPQIQRQRRSLDENWLIEGRDRQVLATLMPLSGESAAEGYLARLEFWAHQMSGQTLADLGIFGHVLMLDTMAPLPLLHHLQEIVDAPAKTGPVSPRS